MQLTEEQETTIADPLDSDLIMVIAFAGAAKTTTQQIKAEAHPKKRGLYLAYNRAAAITARETFPPNATCKTMHALAYPRFGSRYARKLAGNLRVGEAMRIMGLGEDWKLRREVVECVSVYICSDHDAFPRHAPTGGDLSLTTERRTHVAAVAKSLRQRMADPKDAAPMVLDGYLKLFQRSRPTLPYDFIMLDEGQDSNPTTLALSVTSVNPRSSWATPTRASTAAEAASSELGVRGRDPCRAIATAKRHVRRLVTADIVDSVGPRGRTLHSRERRRVPSLSGAVESEVKNQGMLDEM